MATVSAPSPVVPVASSSVVPSTSQTPNSSRGNIIFAILIIVIIVLIIFMFTKMNTMNKQIKELQTEVDKLQSSVKMIHAIGNQMGLRQDDKGNIVQVEDGEAGEEECEEDETAEVCPVRRRTMLHDVRDIPSDTVSAQFVRAMFTPFPPPSSKPSVIEEESSEAITTQEIPKVEDAGTEATEAGQTGQTGQAATISVD
jgi:hypothetical protein